MGFNLIEFLELFLMAVGNFIALNGFVYAYRYKGRCRWKTSSNLFFSSIILLMLIVFYIFPFYFQLPKIISIFTWMFIMLFGVFLLYKNVKLATYYSILKSFDSKNKPSKLRTDKNNLLKNLDRLEKTIPFFIAIITAISLISWHDSLEIIQLPFILAGMISPCFIVIFYYMSEKDNLTQRMRVTLILFLTSIYVTMTYIFLFVIQILYAYISINFAYCTIIASSIFGVFLYLVEYALLPIKKNNNVFKTRYGNY